MCVCVLSFLLSDQKYLKQTRLLVVVLLKPPLSKLNTHSIYSICMQKFFAHLGWPVFFQTFTFQSKWLHHEDFLPTTLYRRYLPFSLAPYHFMFVTVLRVVWWRLPLDLQCLKREKLFLIYFYSSSSDWIPPSQCTVMWWYLTHCKILTNLRWVWEYWGCSRFASS